MAIRLRAIWTVRGQAGRAGSALRAVARVAVARAKMSGLITKPTLWQQAAACAAYGGVSISITLFNKAVFSIYGFKYPNLVMLGQMLVTLFLITAASRYEMVEVSRISKSGLKKVRPQASERGSRPSYLLVADQNTHAQILSFSLIPSVLSPSRARSSSR